MSTTPDEGRDETPDTPPQEPPADDAAPVAAPVDAPAATPVDVAPAPEPAAVPEPTPTPFPDVALMEPVPTPPAWATSAGGAPEPGTPSREELLAAPLLAPLPAKDVAPEAASPVPTEPPAPPVAPPLAPSVAPLAPGTGAHAAPRPYPPAAPPPPPLTALTPVAGTPLAAAPLAGGPAAPGSAVPGVVPGATLGAVPGAMPGPAPDAPFATAPVAPPLPERPGKPGFWRHVLATLLGLLLTPFALLVVGIGTAGLGEIAGQDDVTGDFLSLGLLLAGVAVLAAIVLLGVWSPAMPITGGLVWGIGLGVAYLVVPNRMSTFVESLTSDGSIPKPLGQLAEAAMSGYLLAFGFLIVAGGLAAAFARRAGRRWAEAVSVADRARADSERARADSERARADAERARADAERARADDRSGPARTS